MNFSLEFGSHFHVQASQTKYCHHYNCINGTEQLVRNTWTIERRLLFSFFYHLWCMLLSKKKCAFWIEFFEQSWYTSYIMLAEFVPHCMWFYLFLEDEIWMLVCQSSNLYVIESTTISQIPFFWYLEFGLVSHFGAINHPLFGVIVNFDIIRGRLMARLVDDTMVNWSLYIIMRLVRNIKCLM